MLVECAASCNSVGAGTNQSKQSGTAEVYEGEDGAVAAFRFAEMYSSYYTDGISTQLVLDVAKELNDKLPESYVVPQDITHCGDTKRRPCSAGKLWKRAEEMKKDDMHDAAGADLIRALLKTGIEVDFIQRCERSLQWAFGSIRKQRERERRLAVEEAKLEKRRQEELEAMKEAEERQREYEANLRKFGEGLVEGLASGVAEASIGADGSTETSPEAQL